VGTKNLVSLVPKRYLIVEREKIRSEERRKWGRMCMGITSSVCAPKGFIPDFPVIITLF